MKNKGAELCVGKYVAAIGCVIGEGVGASGRAEKG
jgi:hypothetical protein